MIVSAKTGLFASSWLHPLRSWSLQETRGGSVARYAPSGANTQPWQVHALAGAAKARICADILATHAREAAQHASEYTYYAPDLLERYQGRKQEFGRVFYGALGIAQDDAAGRAAQTAKNYEFFGASVGLIVTIDRRLKTGSWLDLGMFLQNVMLAAKVCGLDTCPQETLAKYHRVLAATCPSRLRTSSSAASRSGWRADQGMRDPR